MWRYVGYAGVTPVKQMSCIWRRVMPRPRCLGRIFEMEAPLEGYAGVLLAILCLALAPPPAVAETYYKKDGEVPLYTNIPPAEGPYERLRGEYEWVDTPHSTNGTAAYSNTYDSEIESISGWYDIDPNLVKAIIKVESDFDSRAVSKRGARGVMQIMPETGRMLGLADPFDPKDNILAGVKYLARLMDMFDSDIELVLAAYNAGENAVIRNGYSIPPYTETINYVSRVKMHFAQLESSEDHGI